MLCIMFLRVCMDAHSDHHYDQCPAMADALMCCPNGKYLKPVCKPNKCKQFLFLLRQLELATRWQT